MQTSSKVSYDNWSDWNLGDKIMNIRPVGTYCFCHCHHHCVDCEFTDSCVKCNHCDCEHCKHDHCCQPVPPCPPHHHCDCHDPHLFPIDTDGDGLYELTFASDGIIAANEDAKYLFQNLIKLAKINFEKGCN